MGARAVRLARPSRLARRRDRVARLRPAVIRGPARLIVLSALMLFVELVLIRWPAERNIYLRYFTNLVLLASFLGVGIGFIRGRGRRDGFAVAPVALAVFAGALGVTSFSPHDAWSPYYRVTTLPMSDGRIALRVNGLSHQSMYPLPLLRRQQPFYDFVYRHVPPGPLGRVLVIGAGSGNDVAVALDHGAAKVDAVEIDPVLMSRGVELHPEDPYGDPRVHRIVDDGRAFLERTSRRYDLIVFALPDSMTLVSGQAGLRLESFLFTREAFDRVRERLTPDGVFTMYNYYRPDVFARYASTISAAFGGEPCYDAGPRAGSGRRIQAVLTISRDGGVLDCDRRWRPGEGPADPSTDEHPFPYLGGRRD